MQRKHAEFHRDLLAKTEMSNFVVLMKTMLMQDKYETPSIEELVLGSEEMLCASPGNEDLGQDNGEW